VDFVGRDRIRSGITHFPEPLVSDDVDRQVGAGGSGRVGRGQGRQREAEERGKDDQRQNQSADEHQHPGAALGPPVGPCGSAAEDGEHEHQHDDREDDS
jgi:hypothetical protein